MNFGFCIFFFFFNVLCFLSSQLVVILSQVFIIFSLIFLLNNLLPVDFMNCLKTKFSFNFLLFKSRRFFVSDFIHPISLNDIQFLFLFQFLNSYRINVIFHSFSQVLVKLIEKLFVLLFLLCFSLCIQLHLSEFILFIELLLLFFL